VRAGQPRGVDARVAGGGPLRSELQGVAPDVLVRREPAGGEGEPALEARGHLAAGGEVIYLQADLRSVH
jgi:hypothetical protein